MPQDNDDSTHRRDLTVSIQGVDLTRIEYRGEQVVTYAMVDRVHQRPEGTARRTYNANKARFVEGEDFFEVDQPDVIRSLGFSRPQGGTPASITLITRRGYLKLIKPMDDDRAWAVQGEMVDRYFAVEKMVAAAREADPQAELKARLERSRETRLAFSGFLKICKAIGITGNHAVLSANSATREMTGVDTLALLGKPKLDAEDIGGAQITVTDIGKKLGLNAREANKALIDHGYQTFFRDAKERIVYEPTEKGRQHGGRMAATGKKHSNGTPVTQLVWSTATADALAADIRAGARS